MIFPDCGGSRLDAVFGIARPPRACTTRRTSRTPAASPWSPTSKGRRSHAIVADGLIAWNTSNTAAPRAPSPTAATVRASSSSCPSNSCARSSTSSCRRPPPTAPTPSPPASASCRRTRRPAPKPARTSKPSPTRKGSTSSAGVSCPSTRDGAEVGVTALGCMPLHGAAVRRRTRTQLGGGRSRSAGVSAAQARGTQRRVLPVAVQPHHGLQGHAHHDAAAAILSGSARRTMHRSAIAIVHSRFSTNTFPSWPLAHPFRFVAHNGEINTVRGNRNRMHAREAMLASAKIPGDLSRLSPICTPEASDSASFDEVLELLHLGGRSLPHAVLMMIPEAWENNTTMDPAERAFWQFHASLMEPWDGPACVTFTDGTLVGAVLDRNGLRPGRWWRTIDDRIILASESGVLDVPSARDRRQGSASAGQDVPHRHRGRAASSRDDEIKEELRRHEPYGEWLHAGLLDLKTLPDRVRVQPNHESVVRTPDRLRLHRRRPAHPAHPDGRLGGRAAGLDGHRHPDRRAVAAVPAALRLLRRTVRAGDQPAAGRDPRRDRHVDGARHGSRSRTSSSRPPRPAARSCCAGPFSTTTNSTRSSTSTTTASIRGLRTAVLQGPLRRRTRRRRPRRGARGPAASGRATRSPKAHARWSSPTATPTTPGRRSRRCWPSRPCTTTWSAPRNAPTSRWSSKAATPARCTTSRCSSDSAPRRSTRIWRSSPSRTSSAKANSPASNPPRPYAITSRRSARA